MSDRTNTPVMSSFIRSYQCDQKIDSKNLFGEKVRTLDPINRRLQSKQHDTLPNFILCTTAFPYNDYSSLS